MISLELFEVLSGIAVALSLYAVWQLDNRVYANIILGGFISAILWFYLAGSIITGNVNTFGAITPNQTFATVAPANASYATITLMAYSTPVTLDDVPLFWVYILIGLAMASYTLIMLIEAAVERKRGKGISDLWGEEEP